MASQKDKDKALKTLAGMREIVKNDMLVAGMFVDESLIEGGDPRAIALRDSGSVCGGHRYCGIGAALIAHGISHIDQGGRDRWNRYIYDWRHHYTVDDRALDLVRAALEGTAERYARRYALRIDLTWGSRLEGLIEGNPIFANPETGRPILLLMIRSAEAHVRRA